MTESTTPNRYFLLANVLVLLAAIGVAIFTRGQNPVINPDGAKYLMAAQAFARGDVATGLAAYKWPAYPMTVAVFSKIGFVDVETGAWLLNLVFRVAIGVGFVRIVQIFGGAGHTLIYAGLVISIYPGFNELQAMVIRDFAYWAFWTWMVVHFLGYYLHHKPANLLYCLCLGLLACRSAY